MFSEKCIQLVKRDNVLSASIVEIDMDGTKELPHICVDVRKSLY